MPEETESRYIGPTNYPRGATSVGSQGVPAGKKEDIPVAIDILFNEISLLQESIGELQKTISPFCKAEVLSDKKVNEPTRTSGSLIRNRIQKAGDIVNNIRQDVHTILRNIEV